MSTLSLSRVLAPAARMRLRTPAFRARRYSSFFSSKSGGGGRYFNSNKPAGVAQASSAPKKAVGGSVGSSTKATIVVTSGDGPVNRRDDESSSSSSSSSSGSSGSSSSSDHQRGASPPLSTRQQSELDPPHPLVNAKQFKLHQFFSLHRPLLLLGNPPSIFHSAPSDITLGAPAPAQPEQQNPLEGMFHPNLDTTPDADAETARQLSRAITMSRVGGTSDWEAALRRLGLDVEDSMEREESKVQMEKDWTDVVMDSTKRKRRKKMKKHKLKKRRRLTRSSRMRLR